MTDVNMRGFRHKRHVNVLNIKTLQLTSGFTR